VPIELGDVERTFSLWMMMSSNGHLLGHFEFDLLIQVFYIYLEMMVFHLIQNYNILK